MCQCEDRPCCGCAQDEGEGMSQEQWSRFYDNNPEAFEDEWY